MDLGCSWCLIRFRSLKLWFVMRMYGAEKLQAMLRHHIALGQWFAQQVAADERFELATPPRFGLTCFRLKNETNAANKQLVDLVNSTGESWLSQHLVVRVYVCC